MDLIHLSPDTDGPLYQRIVHAIRGEIERGELMPGQKLPARLTLAKSLGVNPTTVSQAYQLLERQGLVVSKHGSGTYVHAGAAQRLQHSADRFSQILVIIGADEPTACTREQLFLNTDILAGVTDVLGPRHAPFTYAASLTREVVEGLADDAAVLVKEPLEVEPEAVEALVRRGIPLLGIWGNDKAVEIPSIDADRHHAGMLAAQHLVDCGYRTFGCIGARLTQHKPHELKFIGFLSALHSAGREIYARHMRETGNHPGGAYEAVLDIVAIGDVPECFFVDSDAKAFEVIRALHRSGLNVPGDVAVVSYDDIPDAAMHDPPLTTVRSPRRQIGRRAATLLRDWPKEPTPLRRVVPRDEFLPCELVVRGTSAATGAAAEQHPAEPTH